MDLHPSLMLNLEKYRRSRPGFLQLKKVVPILIVALTACQSSDEVIAPGVEQKDFQPNSVNVSSSSQDKVEQKVVYHINYDDPQKQVAALQSIEHHLKAARENIDIQVVLHGRGLSLLLETDSLAETKLARANANLMVQARISQLKDNGVVFNVCKNSLRTSKIDYQQDLYDVATNDLVENGISKIVELQSQGYLYLKA